MCRSQLKRRLALIGVIFGLNLMLSAFGWSKPKSLSELPPQALRDWRQSLTHASERIIEAPTPPPQYLRRRWEWMRAQGRLPKYRDADQDVERLLKDPKQAELLRSVQRELWSMLGQGGNAPLYESPQERDQRSAQMDLETRGTPVLPGYTHEFIPKIYPHKRMTSWNHVRDDGSLQVKIGGLTEVEVLQMSEVSECVSGSISTYPSVYTPLSLGRNAWVDVKQFDLSCFRQKCARSGAECFLGVFSLHNWVDFKRPRGVASVSPEQSIITVSGEGDLVLSQDDAGNFYLSATQGNTLRRLKNVILPISSPSAYFSGSWSSSSEISSLSPHVDLQLPTALKREALELSAKLGFDAHDSYEELLFKLTDWFRAFSPGTPPQLQGSVYRQLTLSQVGVCRHRSYAFLVTARALGIPTRYITNQVHAFVEVLDPLNRWRRVDLGGEGIAPEIDELTQPVTSALSQPHEPFNPDDGLPRPQPYLDALQSASQTQADLTSQRAAQRSRDQRNRDSDGAPIISDQGMSSASSSQERGQLEALNETRSVLDATSPQGEPVSAPNGQVVTPEERGLGDSATRESQVTPQSTSPFSDRDPAGEAASRSPGVIDEITSAREGDDLDGGADDVEHEREVDAIRSSSVLKPTTPKIEPSTSQKQDVVFDEKRSSRCPDQPDLPSMSSEHGALDPKRVLRSLHHLIDDRAERHHDDIDGLVDIMPQEGAPNVQIKLHRGQKLNRCSWITVSGRVKRAASPRYPPRGSRVVAALQSVSGGYVLHGWGTIGRGGRFRFKAQTPSSMNIGAYQLFVYFPQQRGWPASWSVVE